MNIQLFAQHEGWRRCPFHKNKLFVCLWNVIGSELVLRRDQILTFWPHPPSACGEIYGLHKKKCTWYTLYDMVVDQWCFTVGLCLEVQGLWTIKDIINSVEKLWWGGIQISIQMCKPNNIKTFSVLYVEDPRSWHYAKRLSG